MNTGQKIKAARLYSGITMTHFASKIDSTITGIFEQEINSITTKDEVNDWEHNKSLPNENQLKAIAHLGGQSVDWLLTDDTICEIRKYELDLAMKSMQMFFKSGLMTDQESKTYSRMLHKYGKGEAK